MCGIIGMVSSNKFSSRDILNALKRLEYRGYDSFGYATNSGLIEKDVGEIKPLSSNSCTAAIAHTRWGTHGKVTKANAHPHQDCSGELSIVHNGIIENYEELKTSMPDHSFSSDTDSEVIAHYLEDKLKTKSMQSAIIDFIKDAKGTFAVVVLQKNSSKIYAFRRDSPLVLGVAKGTTIVASDLYAFSDRTNKALFFEEDEFAEIDNDGYMFYDRSGNPVNKIVHEFTWTETKEEKNVDHYMIKEIHEEPAAAERLLNSLAAAQKSRFERFVSMIKKASRVSFVAAGTSYHATLLGVYYLHKAGIEAQTLIASEFSDFSNVDEDTLVIPVSQSGETMDIIEALKYAKSKGAKIAGIVNVPYSTVQRMSDLSLEIMAGQEVCVAATKTFVNQALLMLAIAKELGYGAGAGANEINKVFEQEEKIKALAKTLVKEKDMYIIGRGLGYPVSREIALKLKEISYTHAEGMMGGELKHGTLAMIEEGTPVVALVDNNTDIISNAMEVKARGGRVVTITNQASVKLSAEDDTIMINTENSALFPVLAAIAGQLLTYYLARERGLPIDKPRNLAKSVTVK